MAYSSAGGCGCKLGPDALAELLDGLRAKGNPDMLIQNETDDDAAAYRLNADSALLVTADFFTPITNDAYTYGQIAAANAMSDIYAMGGVPILALALLGWPGEELPLAVAREVLRGAGSMCDQAGIGLSGGHTILNPQPIFGLAVNGIVSLGAIKRNCTACPGDLLFLTKPLGLGILSTAEKKGIIADNDRLEAIAIMTELNSIGRDFGECQGVSAMTDVTGFGLFGHLLKMCKSGGLSCSLSASSIPIIRGISRYIDLGIQTGGGIRNWNAYHEAISCNNPALQVICSDPQSNGGLLVAVKPQYEKVFIDLCCRKLRRPVTQIGVFEVAQTPGLPPIAVQE